MTDIGEPAIVKATVLNPLNIQEYPTDKQIRLDVRVEDETGRKYNVEVQTADHTGFRNRMLYYWSETYGALLERGNDYSLLRPVRSIVITEFSVFPELKRLHTVFEVRARENPSVLLSEHLQIHFLRLGNWDRQDSDLGQLCRGLQGWLQFWAFGSELEGDKMSAMLQDVPEVLSAYDEYKRFTADPVMREKVKARERFLIDQRLDRAEAKEEGRTERNIENARNFKRLGVPVATIAEATGLSVSEVERLG
jgi:predicted transposase/invertase (TIGR01784 family)